MRAYRKDGKLIIEIEEKNLLSGVRLVDTGDGGETAYTVTDSERFLSFCCNQILNHGDNGDFGSCDKMTKLIDALVVHAAESGAGVEC